MLLYYQYISSIKCSSINNNIVYCDNFRYNILSYRNSYHDRRNATGVLQTLNCKTEESLEVGNAYLTLLGTDKQGSYLFSWQLIDYYH